jgi:DNA topoisomerase-2
MFNPRGKLVRYTNVQAVLDDFVPVRTTMYAKRKEYLQRVLAEKLKRATNKVRYIQGVLCNAIEMRGLSKQDIHALLQSHRLEEVDGDYAYLLQMPMISVSKEHVETLMREMDALALEAKTLEGTSVEEMWTSELCDLKTVLTAQVAAPSKKRPHP